MTEVACRLDASALRERLRGVAELRAAVEARRELADGFAFRFTGEPARCASLIEFIVKERECCPFLSFELEFVPEKGPVWLTVRGPTGAKPFIGEELFGT